MKQILMAGEVAAFESSQKMREFAVLFTTQVWVVADLHRCESQRGQASVARYLISPNLNSSSVNMD